MAFSYSKVHFFALPKHHVICAAVSFFERIWGETEAVTDVCSLAIWRIWIISPYCSLTAFVFHCQFIGILCVELFRKVDVSQLEISPKLTSVLPYLSFLDLGTDALQTTSEDPTWIQLWFNTINTSFDAVLELIKMLISPLLHISMIISSRQLWGNGRTRSGGTSTSFESYFLPFV